MILIYILSNNSALVSFLSYLLVNATLSPCFGCRNNVKTSGISSTVMLHLSLYFLRTLEINNFCSILTNFCPMQFRSPAEKGT